MIGLVIFSVITGILFVITDEDDDDTWITLLGVGIAGMLVVMELS